MKAKFEEFYEFEELDEYTVIKSFKNYVGYSMIPDFRGHDIISFSQDIYEIPHTKFSHAKLKSVHFPCTIEKIYSSAFSECRSLRFIQFDEGIVLIGKSAFSHTPIAQVFFPDSLEIIEDCAFKDCNKLSAITFGSGLIEIGSEAFRNTNILSVSLPTSLCKVGVFAFSNCPKLCEIYFENTDFESDKKQILNILNNSAPEEYNYFCSLILNFAPNYVPFLLENIDFSAKCAVIDDFNQLCNIISSDFTPDLTEFEEIVKKLDQKNYLISKDLTSLSKLASDFGKGSINELLFSLKNEIFPETADISEVFKL